METQTTTKANSSMHIIAYITIIGLIIAFISNKDKEELTSYHIRQSLGIGLTSLALMIVGMIPIIGWIISILGSLFIIFLWIMGLMNAINGKMEPVPVFGEKYNEWLEGI
ncbi:hypothetical protein NMK71_00875 [Weeksellaceae bacterium KMM 9713]|uniref:Chloroplast import component protein (Tic20) n=1 Tax=Profundicola chukchiensis TaxID=2961959 RepID=A0A9X4RTT4_9FLAO|nr:hypothetical protein [Profundicola chukchiensis]MDG4944956.1 hypothetical protein [Profundicola chukchiensis]